MSRFNLVVNSIVDGRIDRCPIDGTVNIAVEWIEDQVELNHEILHGLFDLAQSLDFNEIVLVDAPAEVRALAACRQDRWLMTEIFELVWLHDRENWQDEFLSVEDEVINHEVWRQYYADFLGE